MANNEKIKEITEMLENGIKDIFDSENYRNYLVTVSKFHKYSFNNCIMIALQKPDATRVAGYQTWKKLGRQVNKGEKAIKIFAPCPHKKTVVDEQTGEKREVVFMTYTVANVFDVSQTNGDELPEIAVNELSGDVCDFDGLFERISGCTDASVDFEDINNGSKGYYSRLADRIVIKSGMSQMQTLKTLIHEVAHSKMHKEESNKDRQTKEVEAESVAFTVCNYLGMDTSEYSFGYLVGWSSGREMEELRGSLDLIRKTAADIIDAIEMVDAAHAA